MELCLWYLLQNAELHKYSSSFQPLKSTYHDTFEDAMSLSQEICDKISKQLPPWSALTSSKLFKLQVSSLDPSRQKHTDIWRLLFRNNKWMRIITEELKLDLVLIGPGLKTLFNKPDSTLASTLVLCTTKGSKEWNLLYSEFLKSLQPYKINANGSITLSQSCLTLYYPTHYLEGTYFLPTIQQLL